MAARDAASADPAELCGCPVCYEEFSVTHISRTLTCGHTVCDGCVTAVLSAARDAYPYQMPKCPTCRAPLVFSRSSDFPRNYAVESIAETLRNLRRAIDAAGASGAGAGAGASSSSAASAAGGSAAGAGASSSSSGAAGMPAGQVPLVVADLMSQVRRLATRLESIETNGRGGGAGGGAGAGAAAAGRAGGAAAGAGAGAGAAAAGPDLAARLAALEAQHSSSSAALSWAAEQAARDATARAAEEAKRKREEDAAAAVQREVENRARKRQKLDDVMKAKSMRSPGAMINTVRVLVLRHDAPNKTPHHDGWWTLGQIKAHLEDKGNWPPHVTTGIADSDEALLKVLMDNRKPNEFTMWTENTGEKRTCIAKAPTKAPRRAKVKYL